jgi:apoptosis-inducing factor 2
MRTFQERIKAAKKIAVIGGGAVGIEMASDIKSVYPKTDVTLVHSRN